MPGEEQPDVVEVGARWPRSTPGYCTFTATARPSWVMARCTWPIDADAIGTGSHSAKTSSGAPPSSWRITPAASSALIGGASCWSSASALAHVLGQALVEVAGHLAELHQGALHVPERLGDLLGGAQLELGVELLAAAGVGEHLAGPVGGVAATGAGAEQGQPGVAGGAAAVADRAVGARPFGRCAVVSGRRGNAWSARRRRGRRPRRARPRARLGGGSGGSGPRGRTLRPVPARPTLAAGVFDHGPRPPPDSVP